jgi:ADP-glucose pyrophosphorylase
MVRRAALPPAQQGISGTADAVRRNKARLFQDECDYVLILGADHIYKMDYRRLIDFTAVVGLTPSHAWKT